MPIKVGDRIQCARCHIYWVMDDCGKCGELHPVEIPPLLAPVDLTRELCPACGTKQEIQLLRNFVETVKEGRLN